MAKVYLQDIELAKASDVSTKQDTLVSGENIKTINGESLLGSGNIEISISALEARISALEARISALENQ